MIFHIVQNAWQKLFKDVLLCGYVLQLFARQCAFAKAMKEL